MRLIETFAQRVAGFQVVLEPELVAGDGGDAEPRGAENEFAVAAPDLLELVLAQLFVDFAD